MGRDKGRDYTHIIMGMFMRENSYIIRNMDMECLG